MNDDVRLLQQVIDDPVAARAAVPAVAADDQLVDRQVADHAHGQADDVQDPAVAAPARRRWRRSTSGRARSVGSCSSSCSRSRYSAGRPAHARCRLIARGPACGRSRTGRRRSARQNALLRLGVVQRRLQALERLARDRRSASGTPAARPAIRRSANSCSTSGRSVPGGVVDDVAELVVFAVDVADDVDGALGQGQLGRQPGDLGQGGVEGGELRGPAARSGGQRRASRRGGGQDHGGPREGRGAASTVIAGTTMLAAAFATLTAAAGRGLRPPVDSPASASAVNGRRSRVPTRAVHDSVRLGRNVEPSAVGRPCDEYSGDRRRRHERQNQLHGSERLGKFPSGPELTPKQMVDARPGRRPTGRTTPSRSAIPARSSTADPQGAGQPRRRAGSASTSPRPSASPSRSSTTPPCRRWAATRAAACSSSAWAPAWARPLIVDGVIAPMELGHLPYRKGRTFEDYVGIAGLKRHRQEEVAGAVFDVVARSARPP